MHIEIFKNKILSLKDILFSLAWRIVQDRFEAEDIVQSVFLKIWDMREEWDKINNIGAYCMSMVKNQALNRVKVQKFKIEKNVEDIINVRGPHQQIEDDEQQSIFIRLLNNLSEQYQQVVILREFEEKTYAEIAEILNIAESQVKINLFRARQIIRKKICEINNYGL